MYRKLVSSRLSVNIRLMLQGSIVLPGAVAGAPRVYTALQHDPSVHSPESYAQVGNSEFILVLTVSFLLSFQLRAVCMQEDMLTVLAFKRTSYLEQLGGLVQVLSWSNKDCLLA